MTALVLLIAGDMVVTKA